MKTVTLRCAYCHDDLARGEASFCASCLAPHHQGCFSEHGKCSILGCGEERTVRTSRAPRRVGPLLLGLVMLAGALIAPRFDRPAPARPFVQRTATLEAEELTLPIAEGTELDVSVDPDESVVKVADANGRALLVAPRSSGVRLRTGAIVHDLAPGDRDEVRHVRWRSDAVHVETSRVPASAVGVSITSVADRAVLSLAGTTRDPIRIQRRDESVEADTGVSRLSAPLRGGPLRVTIRDHATRREATLVVRANEVVEVLVAPRPRVRCWPIDAPSRVEEWPLQLTP